MTGLELITELFESASIETLTTNEPRRYVALFAEDWTVVLELDKFQELMTTEFDDLEELREVVGTEAAKNFRVHWALSGVFGTSVPLERFLAEGTQDNDE